MEALLLAATLVAAGAVLLRRAGSIARRAWMVVATGGLCLLANLLTRDLDGDAALVAALPTGHRDDGFVSSATCRSCHPDAYHSWHASHHRQMTRPATPAAVLGDFDGVTLSDRGNEVHLERRGDEFWAELVDPVFRMAPPREPMNPPRIRVRIVMATGSHHLQTYWFRRPTGPDTYLRPDDGAFLQLPWAWRVADHRWIPTQDSFLTPPSDRPERLMPWNTSCNLCHSVGTRPHLADDRFDTRTAELGIACEACHGPGAEHVRANQSPLHRYQGRLDDSDAGDPTIVNPARLDPQRSVEVCGQCHSFHKELDMPRWMATGVAYRPGQQLGATKAVFRYTEQPSHPRLLQHLQAEPDALRGRFWSDGTMRVAGREFNGLLESKCHTEGRLTCLSCHSMHDYAAPQDQLAADRSGDASCLPCHQQIAARIADHSHHPAASTGSRCMNCHMPHTTYGLFTAMRSHRIDVPSAAVEQRTGRPNACNLCHLDRSLAWTAGRLTEWYGQPPVTLTETQSKLAAAVRWATVGDAAQRAIAAWAMGWAPARQASGADWQGAFLAALLDDPYAVIRDLAHRSLRADPGFGDFEFDFIGPPTDRRQARARAFTTWRANHGSRLQHHGSHLLLDAHGELDETTYRQLLEQRDNTPIRIIE